MLSDLEPDVQPSNIQVAIRCRPFLKEAGSNRVYDTSSTHLVPNNLAPGFKGGGLEKQYDYDSVFEEVLPQGNVSVHESLSKPVVASVLDGFHGTVLCYGQTGSGKTYTMTGSEEDPGLIQLSVDQIFQHIAGSTSSEYIVRVSYVELYNEKVRDLLNPGSRDLKIRHSVDQGFFIESQEVTVTNATQVMSLLESGNSVRQVGVTNMNARSSRSHTIFRIIVESTRKNDDGTPSGEFRESYLNLVDLAGSERVGDTGATGMIHYDTL
eukprot:SAG31_NODE_34_length_31842_cov_31.677850_20_plen_267_part_00